MAIPGCGAAATLHPDFGRAPSAAEVASWDIDVRPDGRGLSPGSGTPERGRQVFEENCAACHGTGGVGGIKDRLVGGRGTLATDKPVKTIGSYWPYATTLFDYIRRAMPYQAPGTLSADDTYAVVAYLLNLNGIVGSNTSVGRDTLASIRMPNRDGFVPDEEFSRLKPLRIDSKVVAPSGNARAPAPHR
nr:cytochrome c [Polymorphobacter megasporae]